MTSSKQPDPVEPRRNSKSVSISGRRNPPREAQARDLLCPPSTDKGSLPNLRWSFADSGNLPASTRFAAALVELERGAMREIHWHPTGDEWEYYLEGQGRVTVFASGSVARTFDCQAGDVGYVPFAMGHYVENTGPAPHELVAGNLNVSRALLDALPTAKRPVAPV